MHEELTEQEARDVAEKVAALLWDTWPDLELVTGRCITGRPTVVWLDGPRPAAVRARLWERRPDLPRQYSMTLRRRLSLHTLIEHMATAPRPGFHMDDAERLLEDQDLPLTPSPLAVVLREMIPPYPTLDEDHLTATNHDLRCSYTHVGMHLTPQMVKAAQAAISTP